MKTEVQVKRTGGCGLTGVAVASSLAALPFTAALAATFCNPMDLDYRFALKSPYAGKSKPFREAADPEILYHRGAYYLFASNSGGYWKSSDMLKWSFIQAQKGIPIERWDPTVHMLEGQLACTVSEGKQFYRAVDLDKGIWEAYPQPSFSVFAPSFLVDDDGRAYIYGNKKKRMKPQIEGVEFDPKTHCQIGERVAIFDCDPENLGWERPGDVNERIERPWNEGPSISKRGGRYYLQYASPGAIFDSHCEAMLVSERPLGPFRLQTSNPFVYRADGFATGIGGGAVSVDEYGNWWHVGNTKVKVRHIFERRLSLDPVFFDDDGDMYCPALWGDYPREMPRRKLKGPEEMLPKWMLLSYGCKAAASSTDGKHPAKFAVDEKIGTWWAAQGAEPGEWLSVDLGRAATVASVQVNFADEGCEGFYGRERAVDYRYAVETSDDGRDWRRRVDVSKGLGRDATSPYHELKAPVRARYVRVVNLGCNCPKFSVSGLRVFGRADGPVPAAPRNVRVVRDGCRATVTWDAVPGAEGYAVMFGFKPKFLYLGRRVRGACTLDLTMLNAKSAYHLEVVAFNGAGLSAPSGRIRVAPATTVKLTSPFGTAEVAPFGAVMKSWKPASSSEVFAMAKKYDTCDQQSQIHGGFPLCWPWAVFEGEKGCKIHGVTRYNEWTVAARSDDSVTLVLEDSEETRKVWPYAFRAELTYRLGKALDVAFKVVNRDTRAFACTELFHPYFRVGDTLKCTVTGTDGVPYFWEPEADKGGKRKWSGDFSGVLVKDGAPGYVFEEGPHTHLLKDPVLDRTLKVSYRGNPKFVIWGSANDFKEYGGADDPGFGRTFICVEGGNIYRDCAYTLKPGETHELEATIEVLQGTNAN